jgi:hypothetical protein
LGVRTVGLKLKRNSYLAGLLPIPAEVFNLEFLRGGGGVLNSKLSAEAVKELQASIGEG